MYFYNLLFIRFSLKSYVRNVRMLERPFRGNDNHRLTMTFNVCDCASVACCRLID